jgi:hypothetical protein
MKIGGIIQDSLRYPFSDWKNILIFGIFVLIASTNDISTSIKSGNIVVINLSSSIGILFLVGYIFWNVKCSLDGVTKLPKLNDLIRIFIDGIKVLVVLLIYCIIPLILLLIFGSVYPVSSIILVMIAYPFIIAPFLAISIAHMANNDSKFGYAFKFFEIIEKIESVGWIKLLSWYLITVILFVIIKGAVMLLSGYISYIVGIIVALILSPIFYMYLSRSIALIYKSGMNQE